MILIEKLKLLGQGTQKLVYEHPNDFQKVIKLMKPENVTPNGGRANIARKVYIGSFVEKYYNTYSCAKTVIVSKNLLPR